MQTLDEWLRKCDMYSVVVSKNLTAYKSVRLTGGGCACNGAEGCGRIPTLL